MQQEYIQVTIKYPGAELTDILIALLFEEGYEGVEESTTDNTLVAFINADQFNEKCFTEWEKKFSIEWSTQTIKKTNWNKTWESSFEPVRVDDFCALRADFHAPVTGVQYEIIITPKMSFGTGHHATTYMMIKSMEGLNVKNKTVFDFGTGTGVLAILAKKLGAGEVYAIDNDEWSVVNALENFERNEVSGIRIEQKDDPAGNEMFDIILANINKHIIMQHMQTLSQRLHKDGVLVCSGFYTEDAEDIISHAKNYGFELQQENVKENWVCIIFKLS